MASALGNHLLDVRNLAASWPALALSFAALLMTARPRLRIAAAALAVAAFALGAAKMLEARYQRPGYQAVAELIERHARPGDVVIDESGVLSPGPLTGLDVTLQKPIAVFRAGIPAERDHPFGLYDRIVPLSEATSAAAAAAHGGRLFVIESREHGGGAALIQRMTALVEKHIPASYRRIAYHVYPGSVDTFVSIYASPARTRS